MSCDGWTVPKPYAQVRWAGTGWLTVCETCGATIPTDPSNLWEVRHTAWHEGNDGNP